MFKAGVTLWCQCILQLLLLNVSYVVCLLSSPTVPTQRLKQEFYCDIGLHLYDATVVEYYFIRWVSSSLSRVYSSFFLTLLLCSELCLSMYINICEHIYDSCIYTVPKCLYFKMALLLFYSRSGNTDGLFWSNFVIWVAQGHKGHTGSGE